MLCHSSFSITHSEPDVYSGAFQLKSVMNGIYTLEKNPYYWDSKNVFMENVFFVQSDDAEENVYLYNTGNADWITANINSEKIIIWQYVFQKFIKKTGRFCE